MISPYLQGKLSIKDLQMLQDQTNILVDTSVKLKAPDALVAYQQKLVDESEIRLLLEKIYGVSFEKLDFVWVSPDISSKYIDSGYLPLEVNYNKHTIKVGVIPEFKDLRCPTVGTYKTNIVYITLYDYVNLYIQYYGKNPSFINDMPVLDIFNMIVVEAVQMKAADITISQKQNHIEVYFNVNKRKIYSNRKIPNGVINPLVKMLSAKASKSTSVSSRKPNYFSIDLDATHRGRVVINYTYWGYTITIRVLSNLLHTNTFNTLNIPKDVQDFLYKYYVNQLAGLKLLVGPTYSGKNTTIITILDEMHKQIDNKIVSVENPVEILTSYIEQINTETDDEFVSAVNSLLRQNPDIVYIAEMTPTTANDTMKIANTGKAVLSTVHCNSVAEVPSRLLHLTAMSLDEIIEILDSVVYQELLPRKCPYCNDEGCPRCHEAGVVPVFTYLHISKNLKHDLLGKPLSYVIKALDNATQGYDYIDYLYRQNIISEKTYKWRKRE